MWRSSHFCSRFFPLAGFSLAIVVLFLAACPNSNSGSGGSTYNYVCTNGTAVDGTSDVNDTERCTQCNNGFKLVNEQCIDTKYTCEHGTPAQGKPQGNVDETRCESCNAGYFMPQGTSTCAQEGAYFCENGTARSGTTGSTEAVHECATCFQGYTKRSNNHCTIAVYTCTNGTPAGGGPATGTQDIENCQSCRGGYKKEANTCVATQYICSNGTLDTSVSGKPSGNQDEERCQSCSDGYKKEDNVCNRAVFTCTGGTPTPGNPQTGNQDIESCQRCTSGYLLLGVLCSNDVDADGVLNTADSCPRGHNNWSSTSTTDLDGDGCRDSDEDVDNDNDGLIEIASLTMLHNMRYNLSGTGYNTADSTDGTGDTTGGPTSATTHCSTATDGVFLCGYELIQNLTFDTAANGTFSVSSGTYSLDSADNAAPYFVVAMDKSGGWLPIGDNTHPFVAIFEGNNHTITGLAIKRNQTHVGMFGVINTGAHIRNVGLLNNLANYSGSSISAISIGGLVGRQRGGSITASYTTGNANGGTGGGDYIGGLVGRHNGGSIANTYATGSVSGRTGGANYNGGLVGFQEGGSIIASYATGSVDGSTGAGDSTGGLVGHKQGGSITTSYATGNTNGGGGLQDSTGGLVGLQSTGSITASYATGSADGGDGNQDRTGGLVGSQSGGSIIASYATGSADGGDGNTDRVGGLVGSQSGGSIIASYATGSANGGAGTGDNVGQLMGHRSVSGSGGSHTASYGFGSKNGEVNRIDGSTRPNNITTAVALTAANLTGCVGIANEKAYTTQTTCEATSIAANACAWSGSACSDGSNVVDGITCSAFTTQSTCPVSAISNKPAGTWNGNVWNAAASDTAGAWDFGTSSQTPALRYSDYDGNGTTYNCNQFPSSVTCGTTLLPGQRN